MDTRLKDKVALVTGGAQGIGRAISELFARHGAAVGILDIKAELAAQAAQEIAAAGGRAVGFGGDVSRRESFVETIAELERRFGRFDVLVNNAIWVRYGPIENITPEMLTRMVGTGFNSVVWGIQAAAPAMVRSGGGSIVNIASSAGFLGVPNAMLYCGVKAGVLGLTRSAAADLGPQGIRVNAVCPGSVLTEGVRINVTPEMMAQRIARAPLRRMGEVMDIAQAALFLASDESSFMTSEAMLVDGGVTNAFL
ncbi:SDR family NAD(P)-dependent oxidoreductase [Aquabacterium sp.]|uniref:SDR family NAD(P)-dependent oxidoreductase n=1 Tax=Aquabacterium sp. TaxID=1872578 RepID=UPI002B93837F|nr:SDR family oxidoreductase [Aquabacterium sp.]HSW04413.1 SDR family oxidoreductase [Aquabacterium sp.]